MRVVPTAGVAAASACAWTLDFALAEDLRVSFLVENFLFGAISRTSVLTTAGSFFLVGSAVAPGASVAVSARPSTVAAMTAIRRCRRGVWPGCGVSDPSRPFWGYGGGLSAVEHSKQVCLFPQDLAGKSSQKPLICRRDELPPSSSLMTIFARARRPCCTRLPDPVVRIEDTFERRSAQWSTDQQYPVDRPISVTLQA